MSVTNVITVTFGSSTLVFAEPHYKFNSGMYLLFSDLDLPESYQVHFANSTSETSLEMVGTSDGVLIPDDVWQTGKTIYAWLYLHPTEDSAVTKYEVRIPVSGRADLPDGTEPSEAEQTTIDTLVTALNTAVAKTAQDVIDADESASQASASARASAQSASQAQTSAQTASDKADSITGLTATATTLPEGSSASASYDAETGVMTIGVPRGDKGDEYILTAQDKQDIADMVEVPSDWLKAFPTDTASGAVASFTDGADGLPLKSLVVDIDPVQDLSNGDPSPENICPISGWTGMQLKVIGKNLLDPTLLKDQVGWNIIPIYAPVGTVLTMSTNQPIASTSGLLTYFRVPDGAQGTNENVYDGRSVTKTVREEGYLEIVQRNRDNIKSYADYEYQIEVGSTATPYEPYVGRTIPISWQTEAGTVYGGKLDVLSGVLTVEWAMADLGSLNWKMTGTSRFYAAFTPTAKIATTIAERVQGMICSCYPFSINTGYADSMIDKSMLRGNSTDTQIMIKDTAYTDAASFKTVMSGVQLCYELAEPIEIQLTPHEVNSLLGANNIFADTGDVSVEYRADPDLYIQRKMPEIPVDDVQINGTSIVEDGVANVPIAGNSALSFGMVTGWASGGVIVTNAGRLQIAETNSQNIKNGTISYAPVTASNQHLAVFYGLAKAAGYNERFSTLPVGQYTEDAKSAISEMLNGSVAVSGTTPTIVAKAGIRYVCGEVATLDFTPSATGICDVVFTSGSTPTVVTLPSTVKFPDGAFTAEANTTYEINILDGVYGAVMAWT